MIQIPYFARFRPTHDPFIMYLVDIVNDYRGDIYANQMPAEKQRGSYRRLRAAPFTSGQLIISMAIHYTIISLLSLISRSRVDVTSYVSSSDIVFTYIFYVETNVITRFSYIEYFATLLLSSYISPRLY